MKNSRFSFLEIYEILYIMSIICIDILLFTEMSKLWVWSVVVLAELMLTYKIITGLNAYVKEDKQYTKFFICEAQINLFIASIIFMSGLTLGYIHNFGWVELTLLNKVAILIIYILTYIIVGMRYYDIKTSCNSYWATAEKVVKVNNIKSNCLNDRYCKIYMDKRTDVIFDIGKRYKIKYLSGTLGLYVIEAKEVE